MKRHYAPSSFSRGLRIDLNGLAILLISGTASIDDEGETVHVGDFRAQCGARTRTSPGCWRPKAPPGRTSCGTTCYLRDIERDYAAFNEERNGFFRSRDSIRCPPPPASRPSCAGPDLLVEIEAIAMFRFRAGGVKHALAPAAARAGLASRLLWARRRPAPAPAAPIRPARPESRRSAVRRRARRPAAVSSKFTKPYYENYTKHGRVQRRGARRAHGEAGRIDEVRSASSAPSRTTR